MEKGVKEKGDGVEGRDITEQVTQYVLTMLRYTDDGL